MRIQPEINLRTYLYFQRVMLILFSILKKMISCQPNNCRHCFAIGIEAVYTVIPVFVFVTLCYHCCQLH